MFRLASLASLLFLAGSLGCVRLTPRPNLDLAGAGPFLNVGVSDQAVMNAGAHLGWSIADGLHLFFAVFAVLSLALFGAHRREEARPS